jgi:phosphomevalonate kinase
MTSTSAPGKLFLSGEYAVLEGAPAVVTAVDRRVRAWISRTTPPRSPVLEAVADAVRGFVERQGKSLPEPPPVRADSSALSRSREKLGLGSSAAVAAAACGALFEWAELPIDAHRDQILTVARAAHAEAQGGVGSGADVAASVHGGTIVYAMDAPPQPISGAGVEQVFVWSGRSASTTGLLAAVRALESRDPGAYREVIDAMIELSGSLAAAYGARDPAAIIDLTRRYGEAMGDLGRAANADIVVEEHRLTARLAEDCGGAAKPSGAGGGDLALAVFSDDPAGDAFRDRCHAHGLTVIDIATSEPGLQKG